MQSCILPLLFVDLPCIDLNLIIHSRALKGRARLGPQLRAHDILVVGDNFAKDVRGALRCGFRAAWLQREGGVARDPLLGDEDEVCECHGVVRVKGLDSSVLLAAPPPLLEPVQASSCL